MQKIIKVMQMVVVVKLCCVQEVVEVVCFYVECMESVLVNFVVVFEGCDDVLKLMFGMGSDQVYFLVVVIVECGFCGGFNINIVKLVCEKVKSLFVQGKMVKIFCVGKKGFDVIKCDFG